MAGNEMHFLPSCFLALTVQSKAYNMEILLENQTVSMEFTIYPLWLSWKEYLTSIQKTKAGWISKPFFTMAGSAHLAFTGK